MNKATRYHNRITALLLTILLCIGMFTGYQIDVHAANTVAMDDLLNNTAAYTGYRFNAGDRITPNLSIGKVYMKMGDNSEMLYPMMGYTFGLSYVFDSVDIDGTPGSASAGYPLLIFSVPADATVTVVHHVDADSLCKGYRLYGGDCVTLSSGKFYVGYNGDTPIKVFGPEYFDNTRSSFFVKDGIWEVAKIETGSDENGIPFMKLHLVSPTGCDHTYEWITVNSPTSDTEGLEAYTCTKCGDIASYSKLSTIGIKLNDILMKINGAKSGDTIEIKTDYFTCFPQSIMRTIAARRDITIIINYAKSGSRYQITIPANAEVPTDAEYAGFDQYLAGLFGKELLTP